MYTSEKASRIETILTICFLFMLCVPAMTMLLHLEGAPLWENRTLASSPAKPANLYDVIYFPARFGHYFNDRFGLRGVLIREQARFRLQWLGVSSSPRVILGKDNWLFYSGDHLLDYYCRTKPFNVNEMAQWVAVLEARRDWLKQRGIHFLFTIIPEKQTIYPELMPDDIRQVRADSRLDQLIEYARQHSDIEILDLRAALLAAKARHRLYHRTNTHWNDLGMFSGYQEIIATSQKDFPALQPLPENAFELVTEYTADGDLAGMLGLHEVLLEEKLELVSREPRKATSNGQKVTLELADQNNFLVTEVKDKPLPRLVMFRDSFSSALIPFLSEHFSRAVFAWQWKMDKVLIESERPQIVIWEVSERALMLDPPAE